MIDLRYGRRRHQVERLRWTACYRATRAECVYGAVSKPAIGINDYDYLARIRADERGEPPDLTALPPGCAFAPRCSFARDECLVAFPSWRQGDEGHEARCILVEEKPS